MGFLGVCFRKDFRRILDVDERTLRRLFFVCAAVAILTTVGIVFSVIFETIRFWFSA